MTTAVERSAGVASQSSMPDSSSNFLPSRRTFFLIKAFALASLLLCLVACGTPSARIDAIATKGQLTREIVQGTDFRHVVYTRAATRNDSALTVYLESDGLPWISGRVPANDPTSREPLALELMLQSADAAIYVARPCYHELDDDGCSWHAWTTARYSLATVESMAIAIARKSLMLGAKRLRLIGYSGGGVLAVLIAERLTNVDAVITIGANLDVEAWTSHHGYLPLTASLNPARSTREHPWRELHLQGAKDTVVPPATTEAYFSRYPRARRRTFDDYDHVCCWKAEWLEVRGELRIEN